MKKDENGRKAKVPSFRSDLELPFSKSVLALFLFFNSFILQSHAFSQTYGAILPTSRTNSALLASGFSPWRPDAVIGTSYYGIILIFIFYSFSFF
jgi:hypothetical protein